MSDRAGTPSTGRIAAITLIGGAAMLVKLTVFGEEYFDWVKFAMIAGTAIVTIGGVMLLARFAGEPEGDADPPAPTPEDVGVRSRKWAIARLLTALACSLALGWQMIAELIDHGAARPVHWAPYAILLLGTIGVSVKAGRALATDESD
jgi:predicted permease